MILLLRNPINIFNILYQILPSLDLVIQSISILFTIVIVSIGPIIHFATRKILDTLGRNAGNIAAVAAVTDGGLNIYNTIQNNTKNSSNSGSDSGSGSGSGSAAQQLMRIMINLRKMKVIQQISLRWTNLILMVKYLHQILIPKVKSLHQILVSQIYNSAINNYKFAFLFPFILTLFDKDNMNKAEPIIAFTFNMFILNLSCLFCFVNIVGYLLSLYLIDKYKDKLDEKYPRLKRIVYFYSKTRLF